MLQTTILCNSRPESVGHADVSPLTPRPTLLSAEPPNPFDLRRKRARTAAARRRLAELLVARARHLPDEDAALLLAVYRDGVPLCTIAAMGTPGPDGPATVSQVRRRLRRLARRCTDPLFEYVVVHIDTLPPTLRRVATACILHGLSVRRAALTLNLTHHVVRRHRDSLLAVFASADTPAARAQRATTPALATADAAPPVTTPVPEGAAS